MYVARSMGWFAALFILITSASKCSATPTMYLPWRTGLTIRCTQGNNQSGGHYDHTGQIAYAFDFGLPAGEPIKASAPGTVSVLADGGNYNGGWGNYVIINHCDGTYSLYAHMQTGSISSVIRNGQQIQQGQPIGRCGSTGNSTGAHLHIQVMRAGASNAQTIPFSFAEVGVPRENDNVTSNNMALAEIGDGMLVQPFGRGEVYITVGGAKLHIPSANEFNAMGYSWANIKVGPTSLISNLPNIPRGGTMIKYRSYDAVWVVLSFNGTYYRWHLMSPAAVNRFGGFGAVSVIPNGSADNIPFSGIDIW
ncbi:MAG: peptidase [Chthonomonadaceae bacterium]|nr:peptidase [Chthonomonadaceae bacterium]